jgi:putative transposase
VAESFFGSLKEERIRKQIYKNRELALTDVADYIDAVYNRTRRHSHLSGVSPETFESGSQSAAHACPLTPGNSNDPTDD